MVGSVAGPRVLVIDNYDSFTWNLVQELGELGAELIVRRNDAISVAEARDLAPDALIVSPGPGQPEDAGVSMDMIAELGQTVPTLGVCLGHQCIGRAFGGKVVRAPEVVHGKTSAIHHRGVGVLAGLDSPFEATRYHSLVVERDSVPAELEITAETADGLVMAMRHRELPIEGVQFHPESILTTVGPQMLASWLGQLSLSR
jgi:anthranilate synthase/aminodeoxychorismate synthase-like glutamine amidotransferase